MAEVNLVVKLSVCLTVLVLLLLCPVELRQYTKNEARNELFVFTALPTLAIGPVSRWQQCLLLQVT